MQDDMNDLYDDQNPEANPILAKARSFFIQPALTPFPIHIHSPPSSQADPPMPLIIALNMQTPHNRIPLFRVYIDSRHKKISEYCSMLGISCC